MKIQLLLLLAVVAVSIASDSSKEDLFEWEMYKTTHAKSYSSADEEVQRMQIFLNNLRAIKEHNNKFSRGEESFKLGVNILSDMTNEEISSKMKGYIPSESKKGEVYKSKNVNVPASIDWRTMGAVTPVKNQGHCGSCWAFSVAGSLEGQHFLKQNKLVSLSEQNLVDCVNQDGCHGSNFENGFIYVIQTGGIDTEASYPYEAKDDTCRFNPKNVGTTCKSYVRLPCGNEMALKEVVATIGPVSVAIDASSDAFYHYKSGVLNIPGCSTRNLNHAVLVVGYGTTTDGQDYWLIKNSWGTTWGMEGYVLMARNHNNMCGIATDPIFPVM